MSIAECSARSLFCSLGSESDSVGETGRAQRPDFFRFGMLAKSELSDCKSVEELRNSFLRLSRFGRKRKRRVRFSHFSWEDAEELFRY